jgi:aspartate aminotransferase
VSIGSLGPEILARTITINGFSKAYAMTGWRMGYAAAPREIAEAMTSLQSQVTSGASSISQRAALAALLSDQAPLEDMRVQFDKRRRYMAERLSRLPGVELEFIPEGAFYMFPRVSQLYAKAGVTGSIDFAAHLLEVGKVAVVPGLPFGADENVRLSYASSLERITEGMDRIERYVRSLA